MTVTWYGIFVNFNWLDSRWQQYSTHLHTNSTQNNTMIQNTQNMTYLTIRLHKHDSSFGLCKNYVTDNYKRLSLYNLLSSVWLSKLQYVGGKLESIELRGKRNRS
jgi:hypothetical protein